ncbi:Gap junction protein [Edwardsiella piscicida]|nr:Gap junction protein [Edwardsiella piscicida]
MKRIYRAQKPPQAPAEEFDLSKQSGQIGPDLPTQFFAGNEYRVQTLQNKV